MQIIFVAQHKLDIIILFFIYLALDRLERFGGGGEREPQILVFFSLCFQILF